MNFINLKILILTELMFFGVSLFVGMIVVYDFFDKEYLSGNARKDFAWMVVGILFVITTVRLIGAIFEIKLLMKSNGD